MILACLISYICKRILLNKWVSQKRHIGKYELIESLESTKLSLYISRGLNPLFGVTVQALQELNRGSRRERCCLTLGLQDRTRLTVQQIPGGICELRGTRSYMNTSLVSTEVTVTFNAQRFATHQLRNLQGL
jgi:hypothetical protein